MKPSGTKNKKAKDLVDVIKNDGDKRINFVVTSAEHKAMKMEALKNDTTVTKLIKESLNTYLNKNIFE